MWEIQFSPYLACMLSPIGKHYKVQWDFCLDGAWEKVLSMYLYAVIFWTINTYAHSNPFIILLPRQLLQLQEAAESWDHSILPFNLLTPVLSAGL